uniref:hypothetical protein n=1 Tax=uncultured Caulobacter sp. TaxID=158749 RepID=UPI0025E41E5E|nr:hypothetical protein [uncultured Caulobacter sp.]
MTGCDLLPNKGGAQLLRATDERIARGDLAGAEAMAKDYAPEVGPDPVSNRSAWCGSGSVKQRLDAAGARAASGLVDAYEKSTDPLLRYVEVRRAFNAALEGEDQALKSLCALEPNRISTLEYDQARGPIAAEMARIIEPLEEQARSRTGGRNFDKIVAWAEAAAQKADRDDMAARCNDLKKAVAKPNAFEKSAVQQESEDAMRLACSGLDTYSR